MYAVYIWFWPTLDINSELLVDANQERHIQ